MSCSHLASAGWNEDKTKEGGRQSPCRLLQCRRRQRGWAGEQCQQWLHRRVGEADLCHWQHTLGAVVSRPDHSTQRCGARCRRRCRGGGGGRGWSVGGGREEEEAVLWSALPAFLVCGPWAVQSPLPSESRTVLHLSSTQLQSLLSVFTSSLFTGQSLAPLPLLLHEVRTSQPPAWPTQCTVQSTQTLLGF